MCGARSTAFSIREIGTGVSSGDGPAELASPRSTSYSVRHLVIDFDDGRTVEVFHKNFDISPHRTDVALSRGKRECFVYEKLLAGRQLGTPELYGVVWDDDVDCHWLLLEFVHGHKLRHDPAEERVGAARWLGQLHRRVEAVGLEGPLLRYDRTYFADVADHACSAVGERFPDLKQQLQKSLINYETVIDRICTGEQALVHGSYRAKNIIVNDPKPIRICPADWELAAIGPQLHDLAFLADGCDPQLIEQLCLAYSDTAGRRSFDRDQMLQDIDRLRLHKALRSLARSFQWDYPRATVAKLIARVERIRNHLD